VLAARAARDGGRGPAADLVRARYREFSEEPLEAVALLYSAGLYAEADTILGLIENNNPVIRLYQAELESLLGRPAAPRTGPELKVDFAWRLEEFLALEHQLKLRPEAGELYYHLGNFAYAHDLEAEGVALWEKAHGLGFKDKVSLFSLYRGEKKLRPADDTSFGRLEEALRLDPNDAYLFDAYVAEVKARRGAPAAIETLEAGIGRFMNCFTTVGTLLNEYLLAGAYDKLDDFAARVDLPYFWRPSFGRTWALAKMARGYRKLQEKRYDEALAMFEASGRVPETLEKNYLEDEPVRARRLFYTGYCRSKLGNTAGAAEAWNAALDIQRHIRFEASFNFTLMQARYYQAYCLRGLGRPREANTYLRSIREFASSSAMDNASPVGRRHLLDLPYLGLETNLDKFDKYDSELGVTTFPAMTTSVER